jgi:hypothetical protein
MSVPRRGAAVIAALVSCSVLAAAASAPASAAVTHQLEGTFEGPEFLTLSVATDDSTGPSAGDVYAAGFSTVEKHAPDGTDTGVQIDGAQTPQGSFRMLSETFFSGAVAVDSSAGPNSGDVYVSDLEHRVVDRFSEAGVFLCQITTRPPASRTPEEEAHECDGATGSQTPDGSIEPTGIAVDPTDGDVWVSDEAHAAIDEFNPAGEYLAQIKEPHIVTPGPIALDSAGNLYVTNTVAIVGSLAHPENVVAFHEGSFAGVLDEGEPLSVAVDPTDGHVYVFELGDHQVAEYGAGGSLIDRFGEKPPTGPGEALKMLALAVSTGGHVYGAESFANLAVTYGPDTTIPDVTTGSATNVTETGATLHGEVDPDAAHGGGAVTSCEFEYVTVAAFEAEGFAAASRAACVPSTPLSTPQEVSATVALSPSTGYRFRLIAANADGVVDAGAVAQFSTPGPPVIAAEKASTLTAGGSVLSATISPAGFEADCIVEYVDEATFRTSGYAAATTRPCTPAEIPQASTEQGVSATVTGLALDTTYHYRFVSTNSRGQTDGDDQTFATFGINSFSFEVLDKEGRPYTQAGGHPYEWRTEFRLNTTASHVLGRELEAADGNVRDVETELPPGLIAGAAAIPACSRYLVAVGECNPSTQVGEFVVVNAQDEHFEVPLYNVVPPAGIPVELGATVKNLVRVYIDGNVRTGGDYGATAKVLSASADDNVKGARVSIWGVPQDPSHNERRVCPVQGEETPIGREPCPPAGPEVPLLTNPTSCPGAPLAARMRADSWQQPGDFVSAETQIPATTNCEALDFTPSLSITPDTSLADSPSGLDLNLEVPQNESPAGLATSALRDTEVVLPEGVSVSPSAANGLEACSEAQVGLHTAEAPQCPNGSKIGTVEVTSPLLANHLTGGVYIARQDENPFHSLLAMYITAEADGARVKLAGQVEADPLTGQLTTTFEENPQLPFSDLRLQLFDGPHAALRTPLGCGNFTTQTSLTFWARPGEPLPFSSSFPVTSCPNPGFAPKFTAGTENPVAGTYSPFDLRISREDGNQELAGLETTLPPGLIGSLKGVPYCPDSVLASISSTEGTGVAQEQHPSCPAASQVGTVTVGAGPGSQPFFTQAGRAYLAGPYKGAPLSLAVVAPAVAGPFDLGSVVVRNALRVDPQTTQITTVSDPLPRILHGIPLDLRDIRVDLDRPNFTLNPTSCEPKTISASISSTEGQTVHPTEHFQVGDCGALGFAPRLKLSLKGSTKHAGHPALKAVLTYPKEGAYANIARAQVNLPHSEFIDQGNLDKTCTRPVLLAGNCPATSIYGRARAWTPLLDKPLEGPVYLVGGFGYKLPALVAELDGQIRVFLVGRVDSGRNHGIRNTFEAVPDAPVEKFELQLKGGTKYSLLENSENLCAKPQRAIAKFIGQNGAVDRMKPLIANDCGRGKKPAKGKRHKKR